MMVDHRRQISAAESKKKGANSAARIAKDDCDVLNIADPVVGTARAQSPVLLDDDAFDKIEMDFDAINDLETDKTFENMNPVYASYNDSISIASFGGDSIGGTASSDNSIDKLLNMDIIDIDKYNSSGNNHYFLNDTNNMNTGARYNSTNNRKNDNNNTLGNSFNNGAVFPIETSANITATATTTNSNTDTTNGIKTVNNFAYNFAVHHNLDPTDFSSSLPSTQQQHSILIQHQQHQQKESIRTIVNNQLSQLPQNHQMIQLDVAGLEREKMKLLQKLQEIEQSDLQGRGTSVLQQTKQQQMQLQYQQQLQLQRQQQSLLQQQQEQQQQQRQHQMQKLQQSLLHQQHQQRQQQQMQKQQQLLLQQQQQQQQQQQMQKQHQLLLNHQQYGLTALRSVPTPMATVLLRTNSVESFAMQNQQKQQQSQLHHQNNQYMIPRPLSPTPIRNIITIDSNTTINSNINSNNNMMSASSVSSDVVVERMETPLQRFLRKKGGFAVDESQQDQQKQSTTTTVNTMGAATSYNLQNVNSDSKRNVSDGTTFINRQMMSNLERSVNNNNNIRGRLGSVGLLSSGRHRAEGDNLRASSFHAPASVLTLENKDLIRRNSSHITGRATVVATTNISSEISTNPYEPAGIVPRHASEDHIVPLRRATIGAGAAKTQIRRYTHNRSNSSLGNLTKSQRSLGSENSSGSLLPIKRGGSRGSIAKFKLGGIPTAVGSIHGFDEERIQ